MDKFLQQIANVLEMESISEEVELSALPQLDSVGVLTVVAMLDATYGVNIGTADFAQMRTIGELKNLVQTLISQKGCL